ncbi:NUDIX domain-containing protein [Mesorhizobium sp. CAU 1741]|uniref:NUDIX domain-containing protein n=1 Tax=Mesorhizobium sp. CAU 1741 TaxID=3140366 RepID=UPI00325C0551
MNARRWNEGVWSRLRGRAFHALFLVLRPMTLGVRGVVHDATANTVFLVRHTYVSGWHLPGGGVEAGETAWRALERELSEEGNIEIVGVPALRSFHFNRDASRRDHVAVYLVADYRQTAPKEPDMEVAESGFFPITALPEGTTSATRRRLAEVFGGLAPSPEW